MMRGQAAALFSQPAISVGVIHRLRTSVNWWKSAPRTAVIRRNRKRDEVSHPIPSRLPLEQPATLVVGAGRRQQLAEEWMRGIWARLEFWVELAAHHIGVVAQFADLYQLPIR